MAARADGIDIAAKAWRRNVNTERAGFLKLERDAQGGITAQGVREDHIHCSAYQVPRPAPWRARSPFSVRAAT